MNLSAWFGGSSSTLQTSGVLSREVFLKFATQNIEMMQSEEFISELRDVNEKGKDIEDHIEAMQFKTFESLGVQGHFGMGQLRHISEQFKTDTEVMNALMGLAASEEGVLDMIELDPDSFAAKQKATEEIANFQAVMADIAQSMPEPLQKEFLSAVQKELMVSAGQVKVPPNASPEEGLAATHRQLHLTCSALRKLGYAVPDFESLKASSNSSSATGGAEEADSTTDAAGGQAGARIGGCCRNGTCKAAQTGGQGDECAAGRASAAVIAATKPSALSAAEEEAFLASMGAMGVARSGRDD